jgi:hypothetical protein
LNWRFFRVIWLVPYFFRILKLYQIWNFHRVYVKTEDEVHSTHTGLSASVLMTEKDRRIASYRRRKKCKTYFIQEQNVILWFVVAMVPFLFLAIAEPFFHFAQLNLPVFAMQQCYNVSQAVYERIMAEAMMWFLLTEGLYNVIFFYQMWMIRDIEDQFNISNECKVSITIKFVTDFFYCACLIFLYDSFFVVMGFVQYIQVALNLTLLYLCAIKPISKSYEPNMIVPFPINDELISNL